MIWRFDLYFKNNNLKLLRIRLPMSVYPQPMQENIWCPAGWLRSHCVVSSASVVWDVLCVFFFNEMWLISMCVSRNRQCDFNLLSHWQFRMHCWLIGLLVFTGRRFMAKVIWCHCSFLYAFLPLIKVRSDISWKWKTLNMLMYWIMLEETDAVSQPPTTL